MKTEQFSRELGSFVTLALRQKQPVKLAAHFDGRGNMVDEPIELQLDDPSPLSKKEFASIEEMMDKYLLLRRYMPPTKRIDELKIVGNEKDKEIFEKQKKDTDYKMVRIDENQFNIAKKVAQYVERVHGCYEREEHREARKAYDKLHDFLNASRKNFFGDFESVLEIEEAFGSHAIGTNGNPAVASGGAVIFVIIEIYVSS